MIERAFLLCTGFAGVFCLLAAPLLADDAEPAATPPAENAPANGALETIARMRSAHERIERSETGEETQALQRQVLADLDALIAAAGSSSLSPDQPTEESAPPEERPAPAEGHAQGAEAGSGETLSKRPEDSDEKAQPADSAQAARARREKLVGEIWGHLPERIRRELLNVSADNPLPGYEDLVRDYFEALAGPAVDSDPPPAARPPVD